MPTTPAIDPNVRIGHMHLKVADIDRSLHFYCGVLGFLVVEHWGTMQHLSLQATTTPYRAQYLAEPRRNASTRWHNRAVSRRYPVPHSSKPC